MPRYLYDDNRHGMRKEMIYCIEDDQAIRNLMIYALNGAGLDAIGFDCAESFWQAWAQTKSQMVMIDVMLPGEDGLSVLKKLRSDTVAMPVPVIITSAKGEEYDKVIGLDLGADDYLAKPFGMMEMISRVKAVLRRTEALKPIGTLRKGLLEMNVDEHAVYVDGNAIPLTLKEYDLLYLFLTNPGRTFSRENLLTLVWNDNYLGETRTVDVHIGTLRSKLGICAGLIETVRGVGYKLGGQK